MGYYFKKNSKVKELKTATFVSENGITEFGKFLSENFANITYKGTIKDGTITRFSSLEDLLAYPNFDKRRLVGLDIECESEDRSLEITFNAMRFIFPETIKYTLRYNNSEWGYSFEDELNERLKDFKPWYNIFTFTDLTFGIPIIGTIVALVVFALDFFAKQIGFLGFLSYDYNSNNGGNLILGYIWLIPIFIVSFLIDKLRNYLFPLIFIAIGKQKERYKIRQQVAYVLFGVIGAGILINVVSFYLTR